MSKDKKKTPIFSSLLELKNTDGQDFNMSLQCDISFFNFEITYNIFFSFSPEQNLSGTFLVFQACRSIYGFDT